MQYPKTLCRNYKLLPQIYKKLKSKDPDAQDLNLGAITDKTVKTTEEAFHTTFENINEEGIITSAKQAQGKGRPTLVSTDTWKKILRSKRFNAHSKKLADGIACLTK